MKKCLACKIEFDNENWICPLCAWAPQIINGFYSFAAELSISNDGMDQNAHHSLNKLQENSFWFRKRNQIIQDAVQKYCPYAANVLEIGCGSGYVLSGIRTILPSARLTATEIYSNGLTYASARISQPARFLQIDARQLPFISEFELIGAFDVLEHIEEDGFVIENIKHALKPSGCVILTVPQHPSLWSKVDEMACHKRRYKRKELTTLLRAHEFDILLDTSFMFFLLPLIYLQRLVGSKHHGYNPWKELVLPKYWDKIFGAIVECERLLISNGVRFAIGSSRLVVATKRSNYKVVSI